MLLTCEWHAACFDTTIIPVILYSLYYRYTDMGEDCYILLMLLSFLSTDPSMSMNRFWRNFASVAVKLRN